MLRLLVPLLATASAARPCDSCEAGSSCGICLVLLTETECPADRHAFTQMNVQRRCRGDLGIGKFCEGNGECGTDNEADNCVGSWWTSGGGRDIYRRETCTVTTPQAPPPPAPPPAASCELLHCDAGASCGICLQAVPYEQCPSFWKSDWVLHSCDKAAPGQLCEADGECGTTEVNNCAGRDRHGGHGHARRAQAGAAGDGPDRGFPADDAEPSRPSDRHWRRHNATDVFRRMECTYPHPPPAPPPPPLPLCSACEAGASCGVCLMRVPEPRCPPALHSDSELRNCDVVGVGEMCEADGECGASDRTNNCAGTDGKKRSGTRGHADVFERVECAGPFPDDAGGGGRRGGHGGHGGQGLPPSLLLVLAAGIGAGVALPRWRRRQLGGAPTSAAPPATLQDGAGPTSNTRTEHESAECMSEPLRLAAAPMGQSDALPSVVESGEARSSAHSCETERLHR